MLEGLFSQLAIPPTIKVPPVPPEKTKAETKSINSTVKAADQHKTAAIRVYCYRVKEKPHSELVVIMPNTELDEAYGKLRLKYGDRLLTVYEGKLT